MESYVVYKEDNLLVVGEAYDFTSLSKKVGIHITSLREHFIDRHNPSRFVNCTWKITTRTEYEKIKALAHGN